MTVSTINSVAEFVTNGVTKNFPFYFKFLESKDLVVTYISPEGTSSDLVMGTHYTVAGAGNENGGSVLTVSALAGPGQLIVSRDMEAYQQTSLRNQGKFLAETHEDVFDRLTMLIQQGFAIFRRALTRPFGRDYFYAENRRIASVQDPVEAQDVSTKVWTQRYVGDVIGGMTGNPNLASNVFYRGPDGLPYTVQDMSDDTDPYKGAALIGRSSLVLQSLADFQHSPQLYHQVYQVLSHSAGTNRGGGTFIWNGARARSKHNGGTIISPTVPAYTGEAGLAAYIAGTGDAAPTAFGCFERVIINNTISLYDFGAISTYANCTAPIQKALAETRSNNGTAPHIGTAVLFPPEQFMFGGTLTIGSNQSVVMYPKTVLQQIAGSMSGDNAALMSCSGQSDVNFYCPGASLRGVKNEATSGEGRVAFGIYASARVNVVGLHASSIAGDGFTVTGNAGDGSAPSSDVTLVDCVSDFAGRNGFSVINARRCSLLRCGALNTAPNGLGAAAGGPWAGFDIENDPNPDHVLEGIALTDCYSKGNAGNGLQFTLPYSSTPMSINVTNFRSEQDGSGTQYGALCGGVGFIYGGGSTLTGNNSGLVTLKNIAIVRPFGSGIRFRNWSAKNAPVFIDNVSIDQPSFGGGTGNINRCGLWADSSDTSDFVEAKGNFQVSNMVVNDPGSRMVRAVWAVGTASSPMIADIKDVFVGKHSAVPSVIAVRAIARGGVEWSCKRYLALNSSSQINAQDYLGLELSLSGSGGVLLPSAALCTGCGLSIRNEGSSSIAITTAGGPITGSTYGDYINDGTTLTLGQNKYAELRSNGAFWVLK